MVYDALCSRLTLAHEGALELGECINTQTPMHPTDDSFAFWTLPKEYLCTVMLEPMKLLFNLKNSRSSLHSDSILVCRLGCRDEEIRLSESEVFAFLAGINMLKYSSFL
jgi:hypothetical protein